MILPKLDDEQQALAADAFARTYATALPFARRRPWCWHDIQSARGWGSLVAAVTFDEAKGPWGGWCRFVVSKAILDYTRSHWVQHAFPADEAMLGELEAPAEPSPVEMIESFEALLGGLTDREKQILRLVYVDGWEPARAGQELGLSTYRGCDIHRQALQKLQAKLIA